MFNRILVTLTKFLRPGSRPTIPQNLSIVDTKGLAEFLGMRTCDIKRAIQNEQLLPGRHYFMINGVIRFRLNEDLFKLIMEDCQVAMAISDAAATPKLAVAAVKPTRTGQPVRQARVRRAARQERA